MFFNIEALFAQAFITSFFFFFSLSQSCSSKRIGGASPETDEKDREVCHGRQMGEIFDQGTMCISCSVLRYDYDELLCQRALGCLVANIDVRAQVA